MKSLTHCDLLQRINDTEAEATQDVGYQDDPRTQRLDTDRWDGHKRFEAVVDVAVLTRFVKKLLGRKGG